MKIIHCADLHLDSPFRFLDDPDKRKERKAELLKAFENMIVYGASVGASAVIIAGDLFDANKVSPAARKTVLSAVSSNPSMDFYYLKGNHDSNDFIGELEEIPANLHTFGEKWSTYDLGGGIRLTGAELSADNCSSLYDGLVLDRSCFNIVTLHGQEAAASSKDKAEVINLNALRGKGIDYLALGHVHSHKLQALDAYTTYCYPGCLEARGFDESAPHGFMVLDVDGSSRTCKAELVSRPVRNCHVVDVDISSCSGNPDIVDAIDSCLAALKIPSSDLVEINLTGSADVDCLYDESYIDVAMRGKYYYVKLKDSSSIKINYDDYSLEQSLKGEFIRTVRTCPDLSEEEKGFIIKLGIDALRGEEG